MASADKPASSVDGRRRFASVVLITLVSAFLYVVLEWLFFLTKPSFLSESTLSTAMVTLVLAPMGLLIPAVTGVCAIFGVAFASHRVSTSPSVLAAGVWLSLLIPTTIFATLFLLLIDNFTYTIWQFGIVNSEGESVWAYTAVFLGIAILAFRWLANLEGAVSAFPPLVFKRLVLGGTALVAVSGLCLGLVDRETMGWSRYVSENGIDLAAVSKPNILIYTSDGVSATHVSAYGYRKQTTPFIDTFIRDNPVLFFENAYSNAANTGGSLTSLLTSKYPFTVRVLQAPQILRGSDSLEHLPGILRNLGYRSSYTGMRHFADPFDFNMVDAFDAANDRIAPRSELFDTVSQITGQSTVFFLRTLFNRASERILHLLHVRPIEDVYAAVTKGLPKAARYSNLPERLIQFIDESEEPFFAFAHNMGTHGPEFFNFPPVRKFSKWDTRAEGYDLDFYDNAIRGYDHGLQQVVEYLKKTGKLENTIIVIGSDHGAKWNQLERVPLIMYFPSGRHAGRIKVNVQNLDIAPTILDYVGLPKPHWMEGRSILKPGQIQEVPILGTRVWKVFDFGKDEAYVRVPISGEISPIYLFARISAVYCDTALDFRMHDNVVERKKISGHTGGCEQSTIPGDGIFKALVRSQFLRTGYDVSWMDD
jgi:arylsulfatase A-like enzyme